MADAGKCLEGKVVVVTGGGRGIGRGMAMLAAAQGASVIVNDLGSSVDGESGASAQPADEVVAEIKAAGGKAAASYDSVSEPKSAEKIVQCALDNFKRIDGVINNAGILRDRIFHRMSIVDFDQVIKVHLYGAFYVSRAAAISCDHCKKRARRASPTRPRSMPSGVSRTSALSARRCRRNSAREVNMR